MGESLAEVRAQFNGSVRVEVRPGHLTSDAGVIALREALERLQMIEWLKTRLRDERNPKLITYPLAELVTTAVPLLAQGYRDQVSWPFSGCSPSMVRMRPGVRR